MRLMPMSLRLLSKQGDEKILIWTEFLRVTIWLSNTKLRNTYSKFLLGINSYNKIQFVKIS